MYPTILRKLNLLLVLGVLLLFVNHTQAKDVPLPTKHIIDDAIDEPQAVYPADIDGDGALDLIGAATAANTIAWWENVNGDGAVWTRHVIDAAFPAAEEAQAADIDRDGDLDVVGAAQDPTSGEIAWWENSGGSGTIWNKHSIALLPYAMSAHPADIDRDGDLDVVGANYEDRDIYWWENSTGDGSTWTTHTISTASWGARSLSTADIDRDGDLDVLSVALLADDISWWENENSDGSTWTEHRLNDTFDGARSVYATDLDGDSDLDILGTAELGDQIIWWENSSGDATTWIEHTVTTTFNGARSAYPVDLDQDGDQDIVGTAYHANSVIWWENSTGDASAWTEHAIDDTFGNAISAFPVDIDRDGDPDIVGAAELDDTIAWWENETIHYSALFTDTLRMTIDSSFDGAQSVTAADLDGDGDIDVAGTAIDGDELAWWSNDSSNSSSSWSKTIIGSNLNGATAVQIDDINGDGSLDIVAGIGNDSDLAWWRNVNGDGSNWARINIDTSFDHVIDVHTGDINGDGNIDVIGAARLSQSEDISWFENIDGNGTAWTIHYVSGNVNLAYDIESADIDGDNDLDIISIIAGDLDMVWWENLNGEGLVWQSHTIDSDLGGTGPVITVDMDGDGDLDALGGSIATGVSWWENLNGDGNSWIEHTLGGIGLFDGTISVVAEDLDCDGDQDIVSGAYYDGGKVTWWENLDGIGTSWREEVFVTGLDGRSVVAVDINQDGQPDILNGARLNDQVLWWENRGGQFGLATTDTAPFHLNAGNQDDVLQIVAAHNGRSGDHDAELVTFELLLEETAGDPLSDSEANAIIENLHVYRDDGSGVFEAGNDTWVTAVSDFTLANGLLTIPFTDGDTNVQLAWGVPHTYFIVVELAAALVDDPARNNIHTIRLTHVTEASSTGEDRDFDIPLTLAYAANVSADLELYSPTAVILMDTAVHPTSHLYPILVGLVGLLVLSGAVWQRKRIG